MKAFPRILKKEETGVPKSGGRKKFLNRKAKAILCFAAVLVIAFVLMPMAYKGQAETGKVVVASNAIAQGETIEKSDISMKEIGIYGISGDVITDEDAIVGKVATVDIVKDDIILEDKVGTYKGDPIIDSIVGADKRLVSITVKTNAAGLASHIVKGDMLNVSCVKEAVDEFGSSTGVQVINYPELKNLEVYDVENSDTESVEEVRTSKETNADPIISTITFIASDDQANKLIECEYAGNIHVTFVKRGAGVE